MSQSKKSPQTEIQKPEELIERFGGIRPMAKKINAAVTTVQGWKKRGAIPKSRTQEIIKAANENSIDISDLVGEKSSQPAKPAAKKPAEKKAKPAKAKAPEKKEAKPMNSTPQSPDKKSNTPKSAQAQNDNKSKHEEILSEIQNIQMLNKQSSVWIAVFLIVVTIVAAAILLPGTSNNASERVAAIESEVAQIDQDIEYLKQDQSLVKALLPQDWSAQLTNLQSKAQQTQAALADATAKADQISQQIVQGNAAEFQQRLNALEESVKSLAGSPSLAEMFTRLESMQKSLQGQLQLDRAVGELNKITNNLNGDYERLDEAIIAASKKSTAVRETFDGVPEQDLKAAATLFAANQVRAALNRDNESFASDLELVKKLTASENPELAASIDKLAPHAQSGVLTVNGLSSEFRTLTGDIVVASLKGEDVSVQQRATARLNELFSIQKDGKAVTGTDTQAKVVRTQSLLEQGDVANAITEMQSFKGTEADMIAPLLKKAQGTLSAQEVTNMLESYIAGEAYGKTGTLVQDKTLGINVYK